MCHIFGIPPVQGLQASRHIRQARKHLAQACWHVSSSSSRHVKQAYLHLIWIQWQQQPGQPSSSSSSSILRNSWKARASLAHGISSHIHACGCASGADRISLCWGLVGYLSGCVLVDRTSVCARSVAGSVLGTAQPVANSLASHTHVWLLEHWIINGKHLKHFQNGHCLC